jgi:hypothetical protein
MDSFEKCIKMSFEDLDNDMSILSQLLTDAISALSVTRTKLKAFIEWTKQCFHCGFHPEETAFPVENNIKLIRQANLHQEFICKAKFMAATAKPAQFKAIMDWASWSPLLANFLRQLPGCDGVPLSYVICDSEEPIYDPDMHVFDVQAKYIDATTLNGITFKADSLQVHTYIASLVQGNVKAEAAIQKYRNQQCGREDWKVLCTVYEGTGTYKIEIVDTEQIIDSLFYSDEKNGHINWQTFKQKLVKAFTDYNNNCAQGTVAYDNVHKIKELLKKTKSCAHLKNLSMSIMRDLSKPNCNGLTFEQALAEMCNVVVTSPNHYLGGQACSIQNTESKRQERNNNKPYGGRSRWGNPGHPS